ncbi:MAG: response regulator transcription factor [Hahellaceae bacterium]|nr:response regulator transcription factor [Hahellaceae bacterium]MCP5168337.1 response regulator transcription factor [Hahellaceae bacterium]
MTDLCKILITDDEPLARQRLKRLIEPLTGYQICGEAGNGVEALRLISELEPDIVLMDIRMPEMDGMEAARQVATLQHPPALIFCTAYDDYAIPAFKVQAVDYLLKPVRSEALQEALQRASRTNRVQLAQLQPAPSTYKAATHKTLIAKTWRGSELIDMNQVFYFMADQKYVTIHHQQGETLCDQTLKELESEHPGILLRIHRNCLVNTQWIDALIRQNDGQYALRLRNHHTSLLVSRRHVADVKAWMKQLSGDT